MDKQLKAAYDLVLADLEDRNSHTIGQLLHWDITGQNEDVMYRAWLAAKNFIESHEAKLAEERAKVNGKY